MVTIAPATPPPTACPRTLPISTFPPVPAIHGQKSGEKLPSANAAKRARDCVADLAEVVVLKIGACDVAANRVSYKLDDEIDDGG
jgi:hypothetical protein